MSTVAALCVVLGSACNDTQQADPSGSDAPPETDVEAPSTPAAAVPFDLAIEHISLVGLDNAEILGIAGAPPDDQAALAAVTGAREALAAFLDAQFVAPDTRFTAAPIDGLLTPTAHAALTDEHRAGLGQVALPIARTVTGPAVASAQVLRLGNQVDAVTMTYEALLTVVLTDDTSVPVRQAGSMTFLPTPQGWRADAVEVTTDLPETTS